MNLVGLFNLLVYLCVVALAVGGSNLCNGELGNRLGAGCAANGAGKLLFSFIFYSGFNGNGTFIPGVAESVNIFLCGKDFAAARAFNACG